MLNRILHTTNLRIAYLGIFLITSTCFGLENLDTLLERIEHIDGYGPVTSLYGLEDYLSWVEGMLLQAALSATDTQKITTIARKLFSHYVYRDGSGRSRILNRAQLSLIKLLKTHKQGELILDQLAQNNPIVSVYKELSL